MMEEKIGESRIERKEDVSDAAWQREMGPLAVRGGEEAVSSLACAVQMLGHWSAHATVGFWGNGAKRRKRDHNRSLKMTVGSGCSRAYGWSPPTAKSPEEMAQKCAAGRDAVQIAERQEVGRKSWIPSHPLPQHDCDRLGADGEG